MERHLLLTVSENKAAHYSIHFLANLMKNKSNLRVTLFYTAPRPQGLSGSMSPEDQISSEKLKSYYLERGKTALAEAEKELLDYGFTKSQIERKLISRRFCKTVDIIQEAERGLYDAVLLGRRGLSFFEELFDQSVTKEMLDQDISIPVWICKDLKGKQDRKDVLLCLDGSEPSLRAVEHVVFMLQDQPDQKIVLATVADKEAEGKENLEKANVILKESGLDPLRYSYKILKGGRPAPLLLKEINSGNYLMVACGRSGKGRGFMEKIFMGSVSYELFKSLKEVSLCICR